MQTAWTAETARRRAELAGLSVEPTGKQLLDLIQNPKLGNALGTLLVRGAITETQHDAGDRFARLVSRWRQLAGIRATWQQPDFPAGKSVHILTLEQQMQQREEFAKLSKRLKDINLSISQHAGAGLIRSTIDRIVIEGWCENLAIYLTGDLAAEALKRGLDILAKEFEGGARQAS